jgi:hypothetical protein
VNLLVGYFEITATKYNSDKNAQSLDAAFTKPVAFLARRYPELVFEVFEDSLVLSGLREQAPDFVQTVQGLFTSWSADYILARGGISYGEISHMSDPFNKTLHVNLKNLQMRRIEGPGLHLAYQISATNGPGMICLVNKAAAHVIMSVSPEALSKDRNQLIWIESTQLESFRHIFQLMLLDEAMRMPSVESTILGTIDFLDTLQM